MSFLSSLLAALAFTMIPSLKSATFSGNNSEWEYMDGTRQILTAAEISSIISDPSEYSLTLNIGREHFAGNIEGYKLEISKEGITVHAATNAGAIYAIQTLLQASAEGKLTEGTIVDEPAHQYRGLLFDVSRHFQSVEFIKKQLDAMAFLKLNRLHFHLDDSVGWRLELESHPELVLTSAFRKELHYVKPSTFIGVPEGYVPGTVWNKPGCYGGYYTKAQMKEIIEYANSLNITIIPEIEIPGHSGELHASHPELFCPTADISCESICPGNEAVYRFYEEILAEVIELFPSEYIHIGGDEAKKDSWKTCPLCQEKIRKENLKDEMELQSYVIHRISDFVASKGRKIIGWDEIMQGGLCKDAAVMCWTDEKRGVEAAEKGNEVIMTPYEYMYLDKYQNSHHLEPYAITGHLPFDKVSSFKVPAMQKMMGVQGNLWTEYITDESHFEYMLYPRAFAIAEIGWSASDSQSGNIRERAQKLSNIFRNNGYTVFDLETEVGIDDILIGSTLKHKGYKSTFTLEGVHPEQKFEYMDTRLTDGRQRTFMRFKDKATVVMKLNKTQNINVICGVFKRVIGREETAFPAVVKVYVSKDGKNYLLAGTRYSLTDDKNNDFGISYIPVFGEFNKVRYIKMEIQAPKHCASTGLSEIIVY